MDEDIAVELTLDSVIDPKLQQPPQPPADLDSTDPPQHDGSAPPTAAQPDIAESETESNAKGSKQRRKPLAAGSAANFKRKEANRLAAERSRSRAMEKAKAINRAYAQLNAEHEELSAAIAQIELANDMALAETERRAREEQHQRDVEAQVEAAIAVAQQEMESSHGGEREDRSILAALMSGGMGMEGFEGEGENDWVQGVESLIKEVETSGRLGELAAVATVPADSGEAHAGDTGEASQVVQEDASAQKGLDPNLDPSLANPEEEQLEEKEDISTQQKPSMFNYDPNEAAAATSSAVAVVLNAELEKTIRDEVALTRAAISRIEKEIAKANGEDVELEEGALMIAPEILEQDPALLEKASVAAEERRSALEAGMGDLTNRVLAARGAKDAAEVEVAKGVGELLRIAASVNELEKMKIMELLKSIRGYIGNHIWGLKVDAHPDDTLSGTAFSTPAIARRRRGRPPKNSFPLRYNHASLIFPSLPLDSPISTANLVLHQTAPEYLSPAALRRRRGRGLGRSKLGTTDDDDVMSSSHAEEFILSHLNAANEDQPPLLGPNGQPLDPAFQSDEWTESVLSRLKKGGPGSCDICGRTETSVWRKMVLGGDDYRVCNACGLYHRKFGVIRPPSLWGDGEAVKKRRAAVGPDDGRRNRKVKKMLHNADQMKEAAAQVQAEADEAAGMAAVELMRVDGAGADEHEEMLRLAAQGALHAGVEAESQVGDLPLGDAGVGEQDSIGSTHLGVGVGGDTTAVQLDTGEMGHQDVMMGGDVHGFDETMEAELRGSYGEGMFAGME